jgi:hypothetical protein
MTERMAQRVFAATVVVVLVLTVLVLFRIATSEAQLIPPRTWTRVRIVVRNWPCPEDRPYLLGRGDFNGTKWDEYVCRSRPS